MAQTYEGVLIKDYWYIWFEIIEDGKKVCSGVYFYPYKHKSSAVRRAKQMWSEDLYNPMTGTTIRRNWTVAHTNPYIRKGE